MQVPRSALLCLLLSVPGFCIQAKTQEPAAVDFSREVLPIFRDHCMGCHGPEKQKSGYRLDRRDDALKGGESGEAAIHPGDPAKSPVLRFVSGEDSDMLMPPKKSTQKPLSPAQIETLRKWIAQGAPWPEENQTARRDPLDWWSLRPLSTPAVPVLNVHPVDAFCGSGSEKRGPRLEPTRRCCSGGFHLISQGSTAIMRRGIPRIPGWRGGSGVMRWQPKCS